MIPNNGISFDIILEIIISWIDQNVDVAILKTQVVTVTDHT